MGKIKVKCEFCGKVVFRYKCEIKEHVFCSRECSKHYLSRKMTLMNEKLNPSRMTDETKNKIRATHILDSNRKGYPKLNGKHIHRTVAELKLGRPLKPGEVVHHIDGDKQNYSPNNIEVLSSQSEHAKLHLKYGRFKEVVR